MRRKEERHESRFHFGFLLILARARGLEDIIFLLTRIMLGGTLIFWPSMSQQLMSSRPHGLGRLGFFIIVLWRTLDQQ